MSDYFQTMEQRFNPTVLNDKGKNAVNEITVEFIHLATMILNSASAGRETSLAITKLEEAKMWAVRAIATSTDNQNR